MAQRIIRINLTENNLSNKNSVTPPKEKTLFFIYTRLMHAASIKNMQFR